MNLPIKYVLLGTNPTQDSFLMELKVIPITDQLNIVLSIYKLKTKLSPGLVSSISANSENEDYCSKLPKQLVYTISLSHQQSQAVLYLLYQTLNNPNNAGKQFVNVNFNLNPSLQLNLSSQELFFIYTFFNQIVMNYLYFKTEFFKENSTNSENKSSNLQEELNKQIQQAQVVNRPILTLTSKKQNQLNVPVKEIEVQEATQEINFETVLNQAMSLCINNLMTHFIVKYINIYLNNNTIEKEYNIFTENNVLYLKFETLIPNNLLTFSKKHYNDLILINNSINISNVELNNKMVACFGQLIYITDCIIKNPEKYKKSMHLILKIYEMLFFIYALKLNQNAYNSCILNPNTIYGLQFTIASVCQMYFDMAINHQMFKNIPYNKICIEHPNNITYENEDLTYLKECINKHKFLLSIQNTEAFINTVKEDFKNKPSKEVKELKLEYTESKIINIDNLINSKQYPSPLLQYNIIKSVEDLSSHTIISSEYNELLLLQMKNENLDSSKLSIISKKFSQILATKILPKLSIEFNEKFSIPVSTMILINEYIQPNLPENTSIENELNILYRIIIPFLYDCYNVHEFIDYFH